MTDKKIQFSEVDYRTVTDYQTPNDGCAKEVKKYDMFPSAGGNNCSDDLVISPQPQNNTQPAQTTTPKAQDKKTFDEGMLKYWLDKIPKMSLKNSETGADYITPEIKELFSVDRPEINLNDLVDENNNVKKGYELFDLNQDGKLDDYETSYFVSGGALLKTDNKTLSLENFVSDVYRLDKFDNKYDDRTTSENRKAIHRFAVLSNELMDELKDFPEGMRDLYASRLATLTDLTLNNGFMTGGSIEGKSLAMNNFSNANYFKAVLLHELTHSVLDANKDIKEEAITQEVQTHFMESRYYAYKRGDNRYANFGRDFPKFVSEQYELIEKSNPDITKLDIAKAVFMVNRFDEYSGRYAQKDKDKYIYNAQYADIGGYFKEPSNKKEIYSMGIQKALSNATLKDENGKELITDEIKNLFSPDRPIVTYHDLVDSDGNIKPGLELFDLDGDGRLYTEKELFSYITYNDIPRMIQMLDEWGSLSSKNKLRSKGAKAADGISTTESRRIIAENLYNTDYSQGTFNFHRTDRPRPDKMY